MMKRSVFCVRRQPQKMMDWCLIIDPFSYGAFRSLGVIVMIDVSVMIIVSVCCSQVSEW